jgi:8-oxo-dGTP pyrophosphatase MutT (NUDIX family)
MQAIIDIETVRRALAGRLPGAEAQRYMATEPRSGPAEYGPRPAPRQGAVLALLYPWQGRLWLPLTRRSERLAHHGGQVSLPGGGVEPGDTSPWRAALREATEECGIDPTAVDYLGALTPLYVPPSNYQVHPFVGLAAARPAFRADAREVAEIIELPLDLLLDPAAKEERHEVWRGGQRRVPYYRAGGHAIWGATAMMLSELEAALRLAQS